MYRQYFTIVITFLGGLYILDTKRSIWAGIFFGIGFVGFFDETVFHQLLHWHHFYDQSTTEIGLISDGLFHAFSWFATVMGLFMFADLRRKGQFSLKRWWGGSMIGSGGFQLYDGTIQHKLMRIHQIRYVDEVIIYDLVWNGVAIIMILLGMILLNHSKDREKLKRGKKAYDQESPS